MVRPASYITPRSGAKGPDARRSGRTGWPTPDLAPVVTPAAGLDPGRSGAVTGPTEGNLPDFLTGWAAPAGASARRLGRLRIRRLGGLPSGDGLEQLVQVQGLDPDP